MYSSLHLNNLSATNSECNPEKDIDIHNNSILIDEDIQPDNDYGKSYSGEKTYLVEKTYLDTYTGEYIYV
jgi:hypothetical protein